MEIEVRTTDAATVVGIGFDIDGKSAPALQEQILPLLAAGRPLILDMSRVAYMSSAGLRVLLTTHRQATSSNARLVLTGLSEDLRDMMSATGFLGFFVTVDTLDGALESLK
ncbi:MAG TPA: anti-sigma factor antagonist [Bryobacteraceae bacterium]|nr:anti-sigma factor antagonist [Bryobacteraceae bacterium]